MRALRRGWAEARSWVAGTDPGRTRLHLASVATAAMILAAAVMTVVRIVGGQSVGVVMFAVILAMFVNISVDEPDLARRRVTTALLVLPAAGAATLSALLTDRGYLADVVFVLVMMVAVAVRRYGPRGVAVGMAMFVPFFFVQFLHLGLPDLPWLLVGVVVGIGSTYLLRCVLFVRHAPKVLDELTRAFEARLHALTLAVLEALESGRDPDPDALLHRLTRLNETSLLVADRLDDSGGDPAHRRTGVLPGALSDTAGVPGGTAGLRQWIVDAELAAEQLALVVLRSAEQHDDLPRGDRSALAEAVRSLAAATAVGTARPLVTALLESARAAVAPIAGRPVHSHPAAREQRIALAVTRLADAAQGTVEQEGAARRRAGQAQGRHEWSGRHRVHTPAGQTPAASDSATRNPDAQIPAPPATPSPDGPTHAAPVPEPEPAAPGPGLGQYTRQALQVGVATSLAIVVGEMISPARWYWAVIAAFIVFAGTTSRGDVLSRGWARAVGTAGGVVAGMVLALAAGGDEIVSLVLLFACVFLALYLVRISEAMMAFWLTAVLALLYGVIGQFSLHVLLLRVEETAAGAAMGMLAAFLVLPTRSRTAFADALSDVLGAFGTSLTCSAQRLLGRPGTDPMECARAADAELAVVRARARPLEHPVIRRPLRRGVHHTTRVLGALDHYLRMLASQAAAAPLPGSAAVLDPAVEQVRANLDGLRRILVDGWDDPARRRHPPGTDPSAYGVETAETVVDAVETAASGADGAARDELIAVAGMLRRVDQLTVGLARELCGRDWNEPVTGRIAAVAARDTLRR
ncbi:FUSC family protein [Pseudonocardia phyllosphaerae]|uniref:FUSC family protein n=1 Tax=Pseudonocardia phyllosphaerae TaxID=3390502 RepID=UPI00397C28F7